MKYICIKIAMISLTFAIVSCDQISDLMTSNSFSDFADDDLYSVVDPEEIGSFSGLDPDEREDIINDYAAGILSDTDKEVVYNSLESNPEFRDEVTDYIKNYLDTESNKPVITSETYYEDLKKYQKWAATLANIEVYATDSTALDGYQEVIVDYYLGEHSGNITKEIVYDEIFDVDSRDDAEIAVEIEALVRAGEAYNLLGDTILDVNNPTSDYIDEDDAVLIFISCLFNTIVKDSELYYTTEDDIITALIDGMDNDDFTTSDLVFPQDNTPAAEETTTEHYLGAGGANCYIAADSSLSYFLISGGDL